MFEFSPFVSRFGYALRHNIRYDPNSKPGSVRLWCSYNGSGLGADPIKNGDSDFLEFLAQDGRWTPSGTNIYVSFSVGDDDDIFSILTAIVMIKNGRDYSFRNFAGRTISFSRSRIGSNNQEVVLINIHYKTDIGMMTLKEIDEFEIIARSILTDLKYSKQQVAERVELLMAQASQQTDENAKDTGQV